MSTTCSLRRVSRDEIERLIAHADYLETLLAEDEETALPVEEIRPRGLLGLLWRLVPITVTQVRTDADARLPDEALPESPSNMREMDLDKAWHGLHFLFTGTAWEGDEPACFLVRGGEDVGDDEGYRAFRPAEVRRIRAFLDSLTRAELQRRYDPERMKALEIYPEVVWTRPEAPGESALTYLRGSFVDLQEFITGASAAGDGLIVSVR